MNIKNRKFVHKWCHGERKNHGGGAAGKASGSNTSWCAGGCCRLGPTAVCTAMLEAQEQPEEHIKFSFWGYRRPFTNLVAKTGEWLYIFAGFWLSPLSAASV